MNTPTPFTYFVFVFNGRKTQLKSIKTKNPLTNSSFRPDVPGVPHRMQDRPVPIHADGHQTEDTDGAQNDQKRRREETQVLLSRESHGGQEGARNAQESHKEVCAGQGHDVVVGASPESSFSPEGQDDQEVPDDGSDGDHHLQDHVGHIEAVSVGRLGGSGGR